MGNKYTMAMFDTACAAYNTCGTAVKHIDMLKIPKSEKSRLLIDVMVECKGKNPKFNPFYEPEPTKKPKKAVKK